MPLLPLRGSLSFTQGLNWHSRRRPVTWAPPRKGGVERETFSDSNAGESVLALCRNPLVAAPALPPPAPPCGKGQPGSHGFFPNPREGKGMPGVTPPVLWWTLLPRGRPNPFSEVLSIEPAFAKREIDYKKTIRDRVKIT